MQLANNMTNKTGAPIFIIALNAFFSGFLFIATSFILGKKAASIISISVFIIGLILVNFLLEYTGVNKFNHQRYQS